MTSPATTLALQELLHRRLGRIRSASQVQAARHWLRRHTSEARSETLGRLTADWIFLARRHGRNANAQMFFSLFDLLAAVPFGRLPSTAVVRYLLRSLRRFPQVGPWEELQAMLRKPDTGRLAAGDWRSIHQTQAADEQERLAARATFGEMHEELIHFAAILCGSGERPALRPQRMPQNALLAWTDGKTITLPDAVALSPHPLLNRWCYWRLLAHECEHLVAGSFDFHFDTPAGRQLWTRLAARRPMFRCHRAKWDGRKVLQRLLQGGDPLAEDFKPYLPHLTAFTLHFANPRAAHGLFNLVEDVRIERSLAAKYPALGEVARILAGYEQRLQPHPRFASPLDNFLRAPRRVDHAGTGGGSNRVPLLGRSLPFPCPSASVRPWLVVVRATFTRAVARVIYRRRGNET